MNDHKFWDSFVIDLIADDDEEIAIYLDCVLEDFWSYIHSDIIKDEVNYKLKREIFRRGLYNVLVALEIGDQL